MLKLFPATLEKAYMLSPRVKHFIFKIDQESLFDYIPGQFITIHFEKNGKSIKRSYSIANSPQQDNFIEFAAGHVENGPGTELLFNLQPGDSLQLSGPFGRLTLKDNHYKRYILAATSTGVTPYRAMLEELKNRLKNQPELQVLIIMGAQKSCDILYAENFYQLVKQFPQQVIFRAQLSQTLSEELKENQYKGYVQHAFDHINLNPAEDIIYLCGNPGMIDESFQILKDKAFTPQQIIREKYISSPSSA